MNREDPVPEHYCTCLASFFFFFKKSIVKKNLINPLKEQRGNKNQTILFVNAIAILYVNQKKLTQPYTILQNTTPD